MDSSEDCEAGDLAQVGWRPGGSVRPKWTGVACTPSRPRNCRRVTTVDWPIASPGAVRRKAPRREPPCAGKVSGRPGMRLDAKGVLAQGWRRPGGAARDHTSRGSVQTIARRGATAAKTVDGPIEGREPRGERTRQEPPSRGERRRSPVSIDEGAWRRKVGGQGALSGRNGQGSRADRARRRATAATVCREARASWGSARSQSGAPGGGVRSAERRTRPIQWLRDTWRWRGRRPGGPARDRDEQG